MCTTYFNGSDWRQYEIMYNEATLGEIQEFKKEKGCLNACDLIDSYFPNIGKVLEIKVSWRRWTIMAFKITLPEGHEA